MTSPSTAIGPFVVGEKPVPLEYQFQDENGDVLTDITGYQVRFNYRERDGAPVTASGTVASGAQAKVSYAWTGAEFPTPGHYVGEFWIGNGSNRFASILITWDVRAPVGPVPAI